MANIVTHNTNLPHGTVQTYAEAADIVKLDLNASNGQLIELSLVQALALSRIIEAAIRDAQQGTFQ